MARRGQRQEYEGAVQYLGTSDRLVKPATPPGATAVARRNQPTLADPESDRDYDDAQVRQTARRQYTR
jgi:hypothetical protein